MPAVRAGLANLSTVGQSNAHVIRGSLRFAGPSSDYLSRDFGAGNRKIYTISFWAKPSNHDEHGSVGTGGGQVFTAGTVGGGARATFGFSGVTNGANKDAFQLGHNATGSSWASLNSIAKFRDFSAWQHFVVKVDVTETTASDRVKLYANGVEQPLTGTYPNDEDQPVNNDGIGHAIGRYNPEGTDYFDGYLSNFYFIDGQALSPSEFGFTDPLTNTWRPKKFSGEFTSGGDALYKVLYSTGIAGTLDTTAAAAFDGIMGGSDSDGAYPAAGQTLTWTPANSALGTTLPYSSTARVYVKVDLNGDDGGLTVVGANGSQTISAGSAGQRYVDISAATSPITSIAWSRAGAGSQGVGLQAVEIDGTILKDFNGINSFYLPFDGSASIVTDQSGNGNNWTANNITDADVRIDSPSGGSFTSNLSSGISGISTSQASTGYCTWNPVAPVTNSAGNVSTYTNGNLTGTTNNSSTSGGLGTIGVSSGKWYWEITSGAYTGGTGLEIGAAKDTLQTTISSSEGAGTSADAYLYYNDGRKGNNNSASSYGSTYTDGDILGVALDLDVGTISFYKNGVSQGTAFTGLSGIFYPCFSDYNDSGTSACTANFGQNAFTFPVPLGHLPLCTANLPTPDVVRPTQYVGVATYTGTGSAHYVNVGFAPDVVWIKRRNGANYHHLFNTIIGKDDVIFPNGTEIQDPFADFGPFNLNGYTISGTYNGANASGQTYVSWCWKAGGSKNTFNVDDVGYASAAAAGLTGGDITPAAASVGTKQGFSMIKYAGSTGDSTISHGLDKAPDFYMVKCLDVGAESWRAYHSSIGAEYALTPNDSAGESDSDIYFNDTEPTSTVFSVGTNYDGVNSTGRNYMAFLWHDVPGLQKFGKYVANNNADGPYIELGFRPAIVIIKKSSDTGHWLMYDIERNHYNLTNNKLAVDLYQEENASEVGAGDLNGIDLLSNGFKCRTNTGSSNSSGTYLYMAWAYQPMNNLYGGQSNAR